MGGRRPAIALALADRLGKLSAPFRRHASAELQEMYPDLTKREAARLFRYMLAMEMRSQVIASVHGAGRRALFRPTAVESIERPAILATFHLGPLLALFSLLEAMEAEVYVVKAFGGAQAGARELHRGLSVLDRRGIVVVPVDPASGTFLDVEFFGRTLRMARGAFALARLSGAPLIPTLVVWRGQEIDLMLGEAIQPQAGDLPGGAIEHERVMATKLASWLEGHLRAHREDVGLRALKPKWLPRR